MSKLKRNIQYTNKKHSEKGIFSAVLGVISLVGIITAIAVSYARRGDVGASFGAGIFLIMIFSVAGIIVALVARREEDVFYLFPNLGLGINIFDMLLISVILYAGV